MMWENKLDEIDHLVRELKVEAITLPDDRASNRVDIDVMLQAVLDRTYQIRVSLAQLGKHG